MNRTSSVSQRSVVRALLAGHVDLSQFQPYPLLSHGRIAQTEEILQRVRLAEEGQSALENLRRWGILGAQTSLPTPILARVIRQIAATDVSSALTATVHFALGMRLVQTWGREEQVRSLLENPGAVCAFSLTEESPGSDVSRIQSYAQPDGDDFILSGVKHWVTNGQWATHFVVVARTAPPSAADKPRLTAFLVPRGPGLITDAAPSDVLPGSGVARVTFENLRLSRSQILGAEGKGFRLVMSGLADARLLVSAAVLGASIGAYNSTVARLKERRAFGRSVGKFPSVQASIAMMLAESLAMESLVHGIAGLDEYGASVDPVERGVVRLAVSRGSMRVLEGARELYGAAAFSGNVSISRRWADTRALSLLDGSDHALESYIVLEGTREVRHRFARMADATDPLGRVDAAASYLVSKVGARVKRVAAAPVPGMEMDVLYDCAARLGEAVDASVRRYGADLVEKQHIHRRIASLCAELTTWATLSARIHHEVELHGEVGARRMTDVAAVWVKAARRRVDQHFAELKDNDDRTRDEIAHRAYGDGAYPFEIF